MMKGFRVSHNIFKQMQQRYKKECNNVVTKRDTRYDEDPMYQLMYRPNERRALTNGTSHDYIDRFLFTAVHYCECKVGRALFEDTLIARVYKRIYSEEINDNALKLQALCLLMWAEPFVIDFIRGEYKNTHYLQKFNDALPYILKCADTMLHSGFNIYNIREKQNEFVYDVVIPTYTVGPPIR